MEITKYLEALLTRLTSASLNDEASDLDKEVAQSVKFLAGLSEEQIVQEDRITLVFELTRKLLSISLRRMSFYRKRVNRLEKEVLTMKRVLQLHQATFQNSLHNALQCPLCPKQFLDQSFLDVHTQKRHPDSTIDSSSTPLMHRLAELSSTLTSDSDIDRLAEQLNILTEKMDKTEELLTKEREARSSLENMISCRVEDIEKNISQRMVYSKDIISQTVTHTSSDSDIGEDVLKDQLCKMNEEMTKLKRKLNENKPSHEKRSSFIPKKTQYTEADIHSILKHKLKKFGVTADDAGISQDKFEKAMKSLEDHKKKTKSAKQIEIQPMVIQQEQEIIETATKSASIPEEVEGLVESPPKETSVVIKKREKGEDSQKRLTSILKSGSVDKQDKRKRKISFSETPTTKVMIDDSGDESDSGEEEVLKWSRDEIEVTGEEGDRQSPIPPTPRMRASLTHHQTETVRETTL
jgi:hypothetical protein